MKLIYQYYDDEITINAEKQQDKLILHIGERTYCVKVDAVRDTTIQFRIGDSNCDAEKAHYAHFAVVDPEKRVVAFKGKTYPLEKKDLRKPTRHVSDHHLQDIKAPMPGQIIEVKVAVGDRVEAQQPLIVMEAMKMEYTLRAPQAGIVTAIHFTKGDQVELGAVLVDVEPEEHDD